jgi:hypothetical protein
MSRILIYGLCCGLMTPLAMAQTNAPVPQQKQSAKENVSVDDKKSTATTKDQGQLSPTEVKKDEDVSEKTAPKAIQAVDEPEAVDEPQAGSGAKTKGSVEASSDVVQKLKPKTKGSPTYHRHDDYALNGHSHLRAEGFGKSFTLGMSGYLRSRYSTFTAHRFFGIPLGESTNERSNPYAGTQDGFGVADARLNFFGRYQNLAFRFNFDGALVSFSDSRDTVGNFSTGLKDAYFRYTPTPLASLTVGRFKPPFDSEELTSTSEQLFVHRSLESRGVPRQEGFSDDMPGFAPGRQVGVMVSSPKVFGGESFDLGYAAALTNGNSGSPFNDNDTPAVFVRLHGAFYFSDAEHDAQSQDKMNTTDSHDHDGVQFGLSGSLNELDFGDPPNLIKDQVWSAAADFELQCNALTLQGQLIYAHTKHLGFDATANETGLGGHAQVAWEILNTGISPAFRFAVYDPRIPAAGTVGSNDDRVMHFTAGVNWVHQQLPIVTYLEFTHSEEQAGRVVSNDRVELAVQVNFE